MAFLLPSYSNPEMKDFNAKLFKVNINAMLNVSVCLSFLIALIIFYFELKM